MNSARSLISEIKVNTGVEWLLKNLNTKVSHEPNKSNNHILITENVERCNIHI